MRSSLPENLLCFAGTILRRDGNIGKHAAYLFRCAHCPEGLGRARLHCLTAGADKEYRTKSCGCKKRKCFIEYHRRKADEMESDRVKSIFKYVSRHSHDEAAERFKISKYLLNFAWQRWCRHLEALPEEHRREAYLLSQISWRAAIKISGHSAEELRWICRHWRLGHAAQAVTPEQSPRVGERREDALRIFKEYAPTNSITGSLYEDVCLYIETANAAAENPKFKPGRYLGELTQRELARTRRSDFAWVFETLELMSQQQVLDCFGQPGMRFYEVCLWTRARRRERRDEHIECILNNNADQTKISRRCRSGERYQYLPKPESTPDEIAGMIVEHRPALAA